MTQGNRPEDGIPSDLVLPEGVEKDGALAWFDTYLCTCGELGEVRTVLDRKLLALYPNPEGFIAHERQRSRSRFPEMGPCPKCGKAVEVPNG
jgi:hypothetical protein